MTGANLHILMTADAVGGVWQYSIELSAALAGAGHRVTIALMGPEPSADQRADVAALPHVALIETGLPLDWLCDGPEPVVAAAQTIARLAKSLDADLLHCNMPTLAGAAAFPAPVIAVTHGCVSSWWQAARAEPLAPAYHWHYRLTGEGLAAAHAVVAPSASHAATVRSLYGLNSMPHVVHNGRLPLPRAARPAEPSRQALTVGRLWDDVKGARLLDAVAALLPVPFVAAGAVVGPHGESVRLDHLVTTGQLTGADVRSSLAARPVFVSAATFEPFGLAVLEAASAGCPLVLSDIGTFRELWDGAARFVPVGDTEGYARAIETILTEVDERFRLSNAALRRAARYTPAAMAAAMTPIYGTVLGRAIAA